MTSSSTRVSLRLLSSGSTSIISFHFTSFNTESGFDYVTVNRCTSSSCGTKEELDRRSGSTVPSSPFTSSSSYPYLQLVLTSDGSEQRSGFVGTWSVSSGSSDSSPPTAESPSNSVTDCKFARAVPGASSWQVEERTCTPISCGSYVPPANGAVSPTGERTYGQTVTITCNAGYEPTTDERYSSTPSCQANGVFTTGKQCHQTPCGV